MTEERPSLESKLMDILGLTEYEARAYLGLLRHSPLGIGALSRLTGVPRPKCYTVVKSLASKGMASYSLTRPMKCRAVDPQTAIQGRLMQIGEELRRRTEEAQQIAKALGEAKVDTSVDREPEILVLEGAKSVLNSVRGDVLSCRSDILVASSLTPVAFDWRSLEKDLASALRKGVGFRYLVPSKELFTRRLEDYGQQDSRDLANWLAEGKIQFRESPMIHQPFSVFDEQVSYLFFTNPERSQILFALRFEDRRFAKHMRTYFELLWGL